MSQTQRHSATDRISITDAIGDQFAWLDHQAEGNKGAVKRKALHHIEDAGQTEARTQTDYVGRFAIELLQNAHDACADADREGKVRFVLTDSALLVANEGLAFDGPRIQSLVRQGSSEKADGGGSRRTIGYKGVGFSSVFEISDHPQVVSAGDARFQFDRDRAGALVRSRLGKAPRRVAARAFPFTLLDKDLDPDAAVVHQLLNDGAVTVIRLPIRTDIGASTVEQTILDTIRPEALVFMPAVKQLELRLGTTAQTWTRREGKRLPSGRVLHLDGVAEGSSSWLTTDIRVLVTAADAAALREPAWEQVRTAEFTVGLPWNQGVSRAERRSPIHVYFPTDETTGRSILLHGDFVIDSRRAQVQRKGPAGQLNRRFAEHAAVALANLAQSVCPEYSPEVCAALARSGSTSAFGEVFNDALVPELEKRRLLRGLASKRALPVAKVRRMTELGVHWDQRLVPLVAQQTGLLRPDYSSRRASLLLEELDLRTETPGDLARRVRVPETPKRNERALALLQEWAGEYALSQRKRIYSALRGLRLLRDVEGKLRRADEVVLSVGAGPSLPPSLRKRQLARVDDALAVDLIEELDVEHLDAEGALDVLLNAIEEGSYGRKAAEYEIVLRFCRELWQSSRDVLRAARPRLGAIRLPARRGSFSGREDAPPTKTWSPATQIYLGAGWHRLGEELERLYGPFAQAEFLAESAPAGAACRASRAFFLTLGAADAPRMVPVSSRSAARYHAWTSDPEVSPAWVCDDGHPQAPRNVEDAALDRLDELLDRVGKDDDALAEMLASLEDPYGPEAEIHCQHTAHRGVARIKKAPGYQRWRLRRAAWVPVTNDPEDRRHRPPTEAWTGLPRSGSRWLIPRARIPDPTPALELIDWARPKAADVERILGVLRRAKVEGQGRDETADTLLGKLDTIVSRVKTPRPPIAVLALRARDRSWAEAPLIPDMPRLATLEAIERLPETRSWAGLRKTYGLRLASEVVQQQIRVDGERRNVDPLLPRRARTRLLALLARSSDNVNFLADRLKRLQEHPVAAFELQLSANGVRRSTSVLSVHLVEQKPASQRLPTGDLYWTARVWDDPTDLYKLLCHYLQHDDPNAFGFFFAAPDDALRTHGVQKAEIAEAAELLRGGRGTADSRPAFEVSAPQPDQESGEDEGPAPPTPSAADSHPLRSGPPGAGLLKRPLQPAARSGSARREGDPTGQVLAPSADVIAFGIPKPLDARDASPVKETGRRTMSGSTEAVAAPTAADEETERSGSDPRTDTVTERRAVEYVCAYAREALGVSEIRDVQSENKGWDLEFVFADSTEHLVEVKGSRGGSAFAITRNELRQAKNNSNYVLYFVIELGSVRPRMLRIDDLGSKISDEHLVAYQWTVREWRRLEPIEIPMTSEGHGRT